MSETYSAQIQYHDEEESMDVIFSEDCSFDEDSEEDLDIFLFGMPKSQALKMLETGKASDVDFGDYKLISVS